MKKKRNHIVVFEHQSLFTNRGDERLTLKQLEALQVFHEKNSDRYFSLINKGVKFKEYVGVLQIGNLTIEVLPKADNNEDNNRWRNLLIGMLRAVGTFNIFAPSSASLKVKTNSILDLYYEMFIEQIEYLINKGLIKKYRKKESNQTALKGSLKFNKHIKENLVHKERFYVKHTTYDQTHLIHQILFKTILLLLRINTNIVINSRIANLLLNFPEMKDLDVTESVFSKIHHNRKTEDYKKALEISKLILLNYHPDLKHGNENLLALMFDMNLLWEMFIYVSLRKFKTDGAQVKAQTSKYFWKPDSGYAVGMRPDLLIIMSNDNYVLDTKWKNLYGKNPSPEDLRQLYVYHEYYQARKVALIYPGNQAINSGKYFDKDGKDISEKECSVISIPASDNISKWQNEIAEMIYKKWLLKTTKKH